MPKKLPKREVPRKEPMTTAEAFEPPKFTKRIVRPDVVMQPPYYCHCTFKEFQDQKGNFLKTNGDLFAANNGFFPVSTDAMEMYYQHIVDETGSERIALHRVAQLLDLYINDEIIDAVLAAAAGKNPVGRLCLKSRTKAYADKTYVDTMREEEAARAAAADMISTLRPANVSDDEAESDPRAIELFGIGYRPHEYEILMQHYEMLTKQFENADGVQDSLMRDLCTTKLLQMQSRNDPDAYAKLTKLYSDTLKSSGLKTRTAEDYADDEAATWGQFIAQVERFSPAELYETPDLYKDVDQIGDYIERFFTRPTLNYFGKTNDKDPEFSLTEEEINGE